MFKTFFIADLHFGHTNIIEYEKRPFKGVHEMNLALIKNWNSVVSKKDKVIVAGDVSFLSSEDTKGIISKLQGHKILVMGNHDRGRNIPWWYEVGFNEVYKHPIVYNDFIIVSHEPPHYIPPNTPYFYIYGHVHNSEMYRTITKTSACVSVERWDYTPVELEKITDLVRLIS
jgi:calcineurin-like phosphoesterase family protein